MEALMKAINDILAEKDRKISILEWENEKLKKENEELKNDVQMYQENEQNKNAHKIGFNKGE